MACSDGQVSKAKSGGVRARTLRARKQPRPGVPFNAFSVDLEEWFHVCGVRTAYTDPAQWDTAPAMVVRDTETILGLLDEAQVKATFFTVGWVAQRYPSLVARIADAGHEIGCHSQLHRLIYTLTPDQFDRDIGECVTLLRKISGQPVTAFRAPGFSMKPQCFWAFPIIRSHGLTVDVSVVPARRDHGGVNGFMRNPFRLHTRAGSLTVYPMTVMRIFWRLFQFSGGGYLRLFPMSLINRGFRQNHRQGRACISYVHPREINPDQPRMKMPWRKYFKYYVGVGKVKEKIRQLLRSYRFATVGELADRCGILPEFDLAGRQILPRHLRQPHAGGLPRHPWPSQSVR